MSLKIVVTRRIPDPGLSVLRDSGATIHIVQPDPKAAVDRAALLAAVADADVLVALLTERIDEPLLTHAGRLRGVANYAVGFDNIDVDAATRLGIPVANTPGVLTESTADLTWALLLAIARRVPEAHNYMVRGEYQIWGPELFLGEDVGLGPDGERRTLGIIGFGRIGQAVARRARGFDMCVVAYDPYMRDAINASHDATWSDFDQLLQQSDFVSLHAVLTAETHHLIGERELRLMKEGAYLINVARGEMVDETILVRALNERWIAGAALDVYEREPAMADGLARCANAVFVPHIGSSTHGTRKRMATMAANNAVAHLNLQQAAHVVNHAVYDSDAYRERIARLVV
jgi:glyoxylate reductase